MVRVFGRSAFHDTALTSSGDLCYLGGESILNVITFSNAQYVEMVVFHIWGLKSYCDRPSTSATFKWYPEIPFSPHAQDSTICLSDGSWSIWMICARNGYLHEKVLVFDGHDGKITDLSSSCFRVVRLHSSRFGIILLELQR
ncbi:hypothetical protein ACQ4PT_052993 [Festuca glaucescens]